MTIKLHNITANLPIIIVKKTHNKLKYLSVNILHLILTLFMNNIEEKKQKINVNRWFLPWNNKTLKVYSNNRFISSTGHVISWLTQIHTKESLKKFCYIDFNLWSIRKRINQFLNLNLDRSQKRTENTCIKLM